MIFSGPYSPNPAELLAEPLFDKLVAWARENFDYVIIDTPPMGNLIAVSYTHLDVYKRQALYGATYGKMY